MYVGHYTLQKSMAERSIFLMQIHTQEIRLLYNRPTKRLEDKQMQPDHFFDYVPIEYTN